MVRTKNSDFLPFTRQSINKEIVLITDLSYIIMKHKTIGW